MLIDVSREIVLFNRRGWKLVPLMIVYFFSFPSSSSSSSFHISFHFSSPPLHFVLEKSALTTNNLAVEGEGGFLGEESATSVPWPRGKGSCAEACVTMVNDAFRSTPCFVTIHHESKRIEMFGWLERIEFLAVSFENIENIIYERERI